MRPLISCVVVVVVTVLICTVKAGMDQFLRDSVYVIYSTRDDGVLTLSDTPHTTYKSVTVEKWKNLITQKWIVEDFQSIGKYHFTPLIHNTTSNVVTYQFTKNVYSHKRQWVVQLVDMQRYKVMNPESGLCLTNMGIGRQVDETDCSKKYQANQIWKFRMHKV